MTPAELTALKAYMRVVGDEENSTVEACDGAAGAYLIGAGIPRPPETSTALPLYTMARQCIALDYFDNRDATEDHNVTDNPTLRRMLFQLRVSNLDTAPPVGVVP